jgi:hypothetical protein
MDGKECEGAVTTERGTLMGSSLYIPQKMPIWLVFPLPRLSDKDSSGKRRPDYCTWFHSQKEALSHLAHYAILGKLQYSQPLPFERCPTWPRVHLLFDLANGDETSQRYVWFCRNKAEIQWLMRRRKAMKEPVPLSDPIEYAEG